jgi:hypothetical protein
VRDIDRTTDIGLAAFLLTVEDVKLRGVEGPFGRRVFLFDRMIPGARVVEFYSSGEKKLLDGYRSLKALATRMD